MAKKNKKVLFKEWISDQATEEIRGRKFMIKVLHAFEVNSPNIDLARYKTKNKEAILFEYFLEINQGEAVKTSKQNIVPAVYDKARNKIIKRTKGKVDPNSFYLTDAWMTIRNKAKRLYGSVCMKCRKEGIEIHVDHILPRSLFPALALDIHNLQILCKKCNLDKSNKESIDYRNNEQRKLCSDKYS